MIGERKQLIFSVMLCLLMWGAMGVFSASSVQAQSAASEATKPAAVKADDSSAQPPLDVQDILDKVDDLWRGQSSKSIVTMQVKTRHWERSLTMEVVTQGTERTLVKVLKPLKEKGTATLKVDKDIYNYLPKTDRTIKLTAAMMMGAWMGSHFTNDDLVKESRMSEDYDAKLGFFGERAGQRVVEIVLTPKPEAAVVWGKVVLVVRNESWLPVSQTYFDEEGEKVRVMTFSDEKTVSGRLLPMRMRMTPLDKPEEFTELIYENLSFDVKLKAGFFSLNQLRR